MTETKKPEEPQPDPAPEPEPEDEEIPRAPSGLLGKKPPEGFHDPHAVPPPVKPEK